MIQTIGISLAVPQPWDGQLREARRSAGDLQADSVPPHVTLLPPTPCSDVDREALHEHLLAVAARHSAFRMTLCSTGSFRPTSDVVFVVLTQGGEECAQIESDVRAGPVTRTLQFPYHPHVTIAHDVSARGLDDAMAQLADFEASFEVAGFELYEHGSDGVWRAVDHFEFGPSD